MSFGAVDPGAINPFAMGNFSLNPNGGQFPNFNPLGLLMLNNNPMLLNSIAMAMSGNLGLGTGSNNSDVNKTNNNMFLK
jgi:hypothetical protein